MNNNENASPTYQKKYKSINELNKFVRTMKKLLLINPVGRRSGLLLSKFSTFAPLGLAYVGSVTPSNWDIKIADENIAEFEYEEADFVGITAFSSNINRAYEIAKIYRKNKIKVVLGGIHASMTPLEAQQYSDSVVVGEVEGIWPRVLEDFEHNRLKDLYFGPKIDFDHYNVLPRRDLLHPDYFWNSIQTSRGCPYKCHFCSVSEYLGKDYRQRKAEEVLNEISEIKGKYIAFVDDNLIGHSSKSKERALNLFSGMVAQKLNKKWWMQTSINAAVHEQVIEMAAQAGCMFAFIGFETINSSILKSMKKGVNLLIGVKNYKHVVDTFHKYGIAVYGAFIIGNDHESPEYYKQLADFIIYTGIDIIQITFLTPLPGTGLIKVLQKEGRIVYEDYPKDWDKYRFSHMVHRPQNISEEAVYIGNNHIKKRLYTFPNYQARLLRSLFSIRKGTNFVAAYKFNVALKKGWKNSHYYDHYPHDF